ncbi:MAG: type II toxin-antitoxin system HicB family antitoxin [Clostridiales bacterium]|nr:type II toxin-antitoxin system HicB family antitoxin [Clostridiales bacterium]
MRKSTYFAVFEPSNDGGFGVYFPDLLGLATYGKTYEEAEKMAKEALELHLYGMEKDNDEIPLPTMPDELPIDEETTSGYILSPITVYPDIVKNELDNRAVKTNLTIPAWLKDIAEEKNVNYSQLLTTALRDYLNV